MQARFCANNGGGALKRLLMVKPSLRMTQFFRASSADAGGWLFGVQWRSSDEKRVVSRPASCQVVRGVQRHCVRRLAPNCAETCYVERAVVEEIAVTNASGPTDEREGGSGVRIVQRQHLVWRRCKDPPLRGGQLAAGATRCF
jgi:hypothetical protein